MSPDLPAAWLLQAALRATLLLAGLFLIWKFLPVSQPSLRRKILLAAAAGLLAAPWLSGWWTPTGTFIGSMASPGLDAASSLGTPLRFSWPIMVGWVWITGSLLAAIRLTMESLALRRLIREARPWTGSPALPAGLTALQSSAISGPCVACGHQPVLLLPDNARQWSPEQWNMVLAHEQQHLHQQDPSFAWLPRLVHCFYWWHPLAHWLRHQYHAESEALCDRAVLSQSGSTTRGYVEFLLSLNAARQPSLTTGMAMKSPLGQRLERLLQHGTDQGRSPWWTRSAAVVVLAGLAVISLSLRTVSPSPLPGTQPEIKLAKTPPGNTAPSEARLRLSANAFPGDQQ
jgi:hypothetical protein